jgi:hypothetical protein
MVKRLLAVALTLLLSVSVGAQTLTDKRYIDHVKQSVGLLYEQDASGGMRMLCTTTAFENTGRVYQFVTAAHCVGKDDTTKERSADPFKTAFFITFDEVANEKQFFTATPIFVGYQSRGEDFAVFQVTAPPNETWPVVALGDEKTITDGAPYWNIASPLGLGRQVFEGVISSVYLDRPLVEGDINWKGTLVLQQAGVNGGSSGSALISKDQHAIIGFLVGTIGQSTIVAIPVSRFKSVRIAVTAGKYKWWTAQAQLNPDGTPKQ